MIRHIFWRTEHTKGKPDDVDLTVEIHIYLFKSLYDKDGVRYL